MPEVRRLSNLFYFGKTEKISTSPTFILPHRPKISRGTEKRKDRSAKRQNGLTPRGAALLRQEIRTQRKNW